MCLGIPGKIIEIYETNNVRMGRIDFGGVIKEACLDFLPDIQVGDYTIVHVGFGISQLDEEEALKTLDMLRDLDMLADEIPELGEVGTESDDI
jgi:hydrogenase expression/formation protein HypC